MYIYTAATAAAAARCEVAAAFMPSLQVGHGARLERSAPVRWQAWTRPQQQHKLARDRCRESKLLLLLVLLLLLLFVLLLLVCRCCCCYWLLRVLSLDSSGGTAGYSAAATAESSLVCSPRSRAPRVFCGSPVICLLHFLVMPCLPTPLPVTAGRVYTASFEDTCPQTQ